MTLKDGEREALEWSKLLGPAVSDIGRRAGSPEAEAFGRAISKVPWATLVGLFTRWRTDALLIEAGGGEVSADVEIDIVDG